MKLLTTPEFREFLNSLPEPNLSENAKLTLETRYLRRGENNKPIEDAKHLFARVAWAIAQPELAPEKIIDFATTLYNNMAAGVFMFNSPALFNAGLENGLCLSACFVRVPEDSLDDIMKVCYDLALIQKSGGGVGYDFSKLRPKGTLVTSCGATTDGPLPFIDMYCATTNAIQQGAKRRGAQMGMLDIHHPDVWDFIQAKSDLKRWQNMNVSLKVTDEWMELVKTKPDTQHSVSHTKWGEGHLYWDSKGNVVALKNSFPASGLYSYRPVTVGQLFDEICKRAWSTGEPGLAFWDRIEEDWVFKKTGRFPIESTNPCGEIPLENGGSCNLGSINLSKFYIEGKRGKNAIDKHNLIQTVYIMVKALDNIVTINKFPLDILKEVNLQTRRIGLGVMGLAGLLYKLGIPYASREARDISTYLAELIHTYACIASETLAKQLGPFKAFEDSDLAIPRRNAYLTMVAPTGSISILANCESGIEPLFSLAFKREVLQDADGKFKIMQEVNQTFERALDSLLNKRVFDEYQEETIKQSVIKYAMEKGTLQGFTHNSGIHQTNEWQELVRVFQTAADIDPESHVLMQAAWQNEFDQAISKTINISNNATLEVVKQAYLKAFQLGCKGITVYRDGSRHNVEGMKQPMQLSSESLPKSDLKIEMPDVKPPKMLVETPSDLNDEVDYKDLVDRYSTELKMQPTADVLDAVRVRQQTPLGNLHVNVVHSKGSPIEIFAQLSKAGDMATADLEAISRLVSMYLRSGGKMDEVIKQLKDIGSNNARPTADGSIRSLPDGLAVALIKAGNYLNGQRTMEVQKSNSQPYIIKCPECNAPLQMIEKCESCGVCGYSKC